MNKTVVQAELVLKQYMAQLAVSWTFQNKYRQIPKLHISDK